jgi:hypothetical protein
MILQGQFLMYFVCYRNGEFAGNVVSFENIRP